MMDLTSAWLPRYKKVIQSLSHPVDISLRLGYWDDSEELDSERAEETECELPDIFLLDVMKFLVIKNCLRSIVRSCSALIQKGI